MMPLLDDERASADALHHLHSLLIDAVRHRRSGDPHQVPVTVAEIYQELVPYRNVRAALGLELNADYEHTLLRLLAGEAELARLEPPAAREQLAHELESPNPNVTLYRKYAGCDVWLLPGVPGSTPAWLMEHLGEVDDTPAEPRALDSEPAEFELEEIVSAEDLRELFAEEETPPTTPAPRPTRTFTVAEDVEREPAQEPAAASAPEAAAASRAGMDAAAAPAVEPARDRSAEAQQGAAPACAFCDSALPRGRAALFCPFCGADQRQYPCASCSEPMEQGWGFCIACGAAAGA